MNNFDKFNRIRSRAGRNTNTITNMSEVAGDSGFKCLHILWLYPDVMNLHGGRGDVMAMLHICNLLDIPVEIRRADSLQEDIDWKWPHLVYMTAGELKCTGDVVRALERQREDLVSYTEEGGFFVVNGSSGAVLAEKTVMLDGSIVKGLGLLDMVWKERESVWGDDIWVKREDGSELLGNQIQVADVILGEGQEPLGQTLYGRGNNGDGAEGAVKNNVIYTGILGPLLTKNPEFTGWLLKEAAGGAGISTEAELAEESIEIELKSAEYIRNFIKEKME